MNNSTKKLLKATLKVGLILGIVGAAFYTDMALADGGNSINVDIGDISKTMSNSVGYMANIIDACFIVVGVFLFGSGMFKIRQHVLMPHQHPVSQGIIAILLAVGCFSVPTILGTAANSIFGKSNAALEKTDSSQLDKIIGTPSGN